VITYRLGSLEGVVVTAGERKRPFLPACLKTKANHLLSRSPVVNYNWREIAFWLGSLGQLGILTLLIQETAKRVVTYASAVRQ